MGYFIDLSSISLELYKEKLEKSSLIPSRLILKEKLDERFTAFKNFGISNLQELQIALKNEKKIQELLKVQCFSEEFLVVLLREINSIQAKPNKIKNFPGIKDDVVQKLENIGIKDSFSLFEKVKNAALRKELAKLTQISEAEILELTKLTDLSRIKWTGAIFARLLYDCGIDTLEKAMQAKPEEIHAKMLNLKPGYFKGKIGLNDMKLFIEAAKELPFEIEY